MTSSCTCVQNNNVHVPPLSALMSIYNELQVAGVHLSTLIPGVSADAINLISVSTPNSFLTCFLRNYIYVIHAQCIIICFVAYNYLLEVSLEYYYPDSICAKCSPYVRGIHPRGQQLRKPFNIVFSR